MKRKFDLAVIGGGPGGYPAAIRAAQKGLSVALIEGKELGGTCLNRGCIPSKTLIANAEVWEKIKKAEEFGIRVNNPSFDYKKMVERKDRIVSSIRKSLEGLILSNQITLLKGYGKFISPNEIKIMGEVNEVIEVEKTIIATGSKPRNISAFPFDYKKIHDSTSLLNLETLPKSIVIIGGGIIGCEFASLFSILGVDVTIIEMMPSIIPMEDKKISDYLTQSFVKKGVKIQCNAKVLKIDKTEQGVKVVLEGNQFHEAEIALVSVGRALNTTNVGLDKAGVLINENGLISVNEQMETNVPGIYAIGDIASKWWLAHVASHQGIVAAENASGHFVKMNYQAVPSVIYTHPEIATVGFTLENALKAGFQAVLGAFPFSALGKSQATFETDGFAQVVIDKKTGQILGAQVVGNEASTLISQMALAITNELTIECITETIHAHPTLAESWLEAAFSAEGKPIHLPPKRKKG